MDHLKALETTDHTSFPNEATRKAALASARALVARLETPFETMVHMSHEIPAQYAAIKVCLYQDVFTKLDRDASTPKSSEQLTTTADPALLGRFLKHLAAMNTIKETGPDLYLPTRQSSSLTDPRIYATVDYYKEVTSKAFTSLPAFLKATEFQQPLDTAKGNWQYLIGEDVSHFEWMEKNPAAGQNFANLMAGYTSQRGSWLDVYPGERILEGAGKDGTLLVDVGGGQGQDISKFLSKFPDATDRLVLQDIPQVIESGKDCLPAGINAQAHDFFTTQPVKGAKAYFLHSVLHDWPDDKGCEILANIKAAMKPGYSRLLLNEMLIPSQHASRYATLLDLTMAACFSAKERSGDDWRIFLESAGFRIVKIWQSLAADEAVIEAEMA